MGQHIRPILFLIYYGTIYPVPVIVCILCPLVYWNEVMIIFGFTIHEWERLLDFSPSSNWTIFWIILLIILPAYIYFLLCVTYRALGALTTVILLSVCVNHFMYKIWWVNIVTNNLILLTKPYPSWHFVDQKS